MSILQSLIKKAHNSLPANKRARPWAYLNRGIDLLQTEEDLNCYLSAYGTMHEAKIISALEVLRDREEVFKNDVRLIDWGCGQGLAAICYLDFLQHELSSNVNPSSITLIEPSSAALDKAQHYLNQLLDNTITTIKPVNKFLNNVLHEDIVGDTSVILHFFSNILDIDSIDLKTLSKLIKENLIGKHYFVCVGPLYHGSTRIDEFAKLLDLPEEEILGQKTGNLKSVRGTIKLLVFKLEGKEIEIIKTKYYQPMPDKNYMHILGKLLDKVNPIEMSDADKIIEYYKTAVELEQLKEPKIEKYYEYDLNLNDENEIEIDLESNQNFLNAFNRNRVHEQWPKDLIISVILISEKKQHNLLNYTYLFTDIKDINTAEDTINVNLSDLELNYSELSNLNLDSNSIDKIEEQLKKLNTVEEIISLFNASTDYNFTFDQKIKLALSSKNPSLLQTYSELRRLNPKYISQDDFLFKFINYSEFENNMDDVDENDLIQITALDPSQKKAVVQSFNNRLTVITGPPGTGKTQVITNILANAVVQDKKVLVASKNNKAVDNVKARFDKNDDTGYFLRFGSKKVLEDITLPAISEIRAQIDKLTNNDAKLQTNLDELNRVKEIKNKNLRRIEKGKKLEISIPKDIKLKACLEEELNKFKSKNQILEIIRVEDHNIEVFISNLKSEKDILELKYYGLKKIWFNWFSKRKAAFGLIKTLDEYSQNLRSHLNQTSFKTRINDYKNGNDIIEGYDILISAFKKITKYVNECKQQLNKIEDLAAKIDQNQKELKGINADKDLINNNIKECNQNIVVKSKNVLKSKIENQLYHSNNAYINNYKNYLPDNVPTPGAMGLPEFIEATKIFIGLFKIISVTSLSSKASLPLIENIFDMVVIDEASQCDIASALPLILRAKQVVVIGDPLQLKHISSLNEAENELIKEKLNLTAFPFLNYKKKSLWDYSEELLSNSGSNRVDLTYHYRSHKDIIGYSNEQFYVKQLNTPLKIETDPDNYNINPKGIMWKDVRGEQKNPNININELEVSNCVQLAIYLSEQHPEASIGIVTPFRHQATEIYRKLPNVLNDKIIVDTAHGFQGDEKDIMIYSLVVTDNSPDTKIYWIDKVVPELVNVAVTRAKNTLYVVGNKEYIKRKSSTIKPLGNLVRYVEELNQ